MLVADSKQTLLCTYLSVAVLVGLVLNAALGLVVGLTRWRRWCWPPELRIKGCNAA